MVFLNNYVSLRYIQLCLGNRIATCLGNSVICLSFVCGYLFVSDPELSYLLCDNTFICCINLQGHLNILTGEKPINSVLATKTLTRNSNLQ